MISTRSRYRESIPIFLTPPFHQMCSYLGDGRQPHPLLQEVPFVSPSILDHCTPQRNQEFIMQLCICRTRKELNIVSWARCLSRTLLFTNIYCRSTTPFLGTWTSLTLVTKSLCEVFLGHGKGVASSTWCSALYNQPYVLSQYAGAQHSTGDTK